jgi:hypothetical protein
VVILLARARGITMTSYEAISCTSLFAYNNDENERAFVPTPTLTGK